MGEHSHLGAMDAGLDAAGVRREMDALMGRSASAPAGGGAKAEAAARSSKPRPASPQPPSKAANAGIDLDFLAKTQFFRGVTEDEIASMLGCLGTKVRHYAKGEYVFVEGDAITSFGIVLQGSVRTETSDVWGNTRVMGQFGRGQSFGEAYAALGTEPLLVNVVAATDAAILFMDARRVVSRCPRACVWHTTVNANLLASIARKNVAATRRLRDAAPKSIKGKLLAYLSSEAKRAGSNEFDIPFKRQQLADYLGVDRSALSTVISGLQRDGVIEAHLCHFKLLDGKDEARARAAR